MNNQAKSNEGQLNHAVKVISARINDLREKMKTAQGEELAALQKQSQELLASIGLDDSDVQVVTPSSSVAGAMKDAIEAASDGLPKTTVVTEETTTKTTVKVEKPSLWERFKAFCARNSGKLIAGALTIGAVGVGLWYWVSGKNTTTAVSSVSGITEVTVDVPAELEVPAAEGPSIFARIGAWLSDAGTTIKNYAVSAWNWVVGLFNRNNNQEAVNEGTADATPVAA